MGNITLTNPTAGTVITAGLHATNYSAIQTVVNGNIEDTNVKTGAAIAVAKLAPGSAAQVLTTTGGVAVWAAPSSAVNYGNTLPGSPTDGQEAILVDSTTNPTYHWRFRWNNTSANADKWESVGSASTIIEVAASEDTASTTYVALATAGPSFTVPRAGVYQVEIGFTFSGDNSGNYVVMSYDIGGTGAVDADGAWAIRNTLGISSVSHPRTKAGLAASTALVAKYKKGSAAAGGSFSSRWMRVTPVRVS